MTQADHLRLEGKRLFVRRMFDGIAGTYDLLNHLLSGGADILWRRKTIDALRPLPGWRILDLATGTGDLGLNAARRGERIRVIGVDPSRRMLQRGMSKAEKRPGWMVFCGGEAENLPFSDGIFDGIVMGFGIRNVTNLNAGLHEMHRLLRPSGRAVILEFSRPRVFLLRHIYAFYFAHILPAIGRIISRNPSAYRYLHESVMAFPEGPALCRHLADAGFVDIVERRLTFGIATLYRMARAAGGNGQ